MQNCNLARSLQFLRLDQRGPTTGSRAACGDTLEKNNLLYVIVTVSRGTYLGIDQSMKRELVSGAANT